ncbi:MAG: hypothetical protein JKY19_01915 [Alcanivoracaceae bacterium]|nr:hypothetical protein [Alcanivoracaceae bacterium]
MYASVFLPILGATAIFAGYFYYPGVIISNKAMMLNGNQKYLYAINTNTYDVTVFDAKDLNSRP